MSFRFLAIGLALSFMTACDIDLELYDDFELMRNEAIVITVQPNPYNGTVRAFDYFFNIRFAVTPVSVIGELVNLKTDDFRFHVTYHTANDKSTVEETVIDILSVEEDDGMLVIAVDGTVFSPEFFEGGIGAKAVLSIIYGSQKIVSRPFTLQSPALSDARQAFMTAMNQKAISIGMTKSTFINPYGGNLGGYNKSTVSDLLKMVVYAYAVPKIRDVWSAQSVTCQIYGPNARTVTITSSYQELMDSYYTNMHPGQKNPYLLYGSKGGGWSYGDNKAFSFIGLTEISGRSVIAISATINGDGATGRSARIKGTIELFDIAASYIAGQDIGNMSVKSVEKALVAIIPDSSEGANYLSPIIIYSLNPEEAFNPASTTKVLAMMTMVDIIDNYEERHTILSSDLLNDSSTYAAQAGDIESINTSLYAMMLASNAANTLSLARVCGEKILESRAKSFSE